MNDRRLPGMDETADERFDRLCPPPPRTDADVEDEAWRELEQRLNGQTRDGGTG